MYPTAPLRLQGNTIESEHLSELTEEEYEAQIFHRQDLKGFMWLDAKYLNPFFTRRLTQEVRWRACGLLSALAALFLHHRPSVCLKGPFTRSDPDEVSDQQVVRRGPPGALGLRRRRGRN